MPVAVILGSAFSQGLEQAAEPVVCLTPFGEVTLHRAERGWVLFRHGLPHRWLPNQIPYRAQAWALHAQGVEALLVTSSVGVLNPYLPLFMPMLVSDVVMLENRLPDGSACTMFPTPTEGQGHLVLEEGLLSGALKAQLRALADDEGVPLPQREVVFSYAQGPRTKTAAENALLARQGMEVNSMTLAPELVLANELGIPAAALVVGHKRSVPGGPTLSDADIAGSLERSNAAMSRIVRAFLARGAPVPFGNRLYRFG
ncbi:MAG: 5'-methylthioadenosine phosphorylase [Alphaproteobacteria bacterium]|nr:5'-methylthioadenosine phosphorylase [Alphaproteobacteria bacterium]